MNETAPTIINPDMYMECEMGYGTPCWLWLGELTVGGYASYTTHGHSMGVHRAYYSAARGPIPGGKQLDHLCRERSCVNPWHLEAVEPAENVQRGKAAKLTQRQVVAIRQAPDAKHLDQAAVFAVAPSSIDGIHKRRTWKNVDPT